MVAAYCMPASGGAGGHGGSGGDGDGDGRGGSGGDVAFVTFTANAVAEATARGETERAPRRMRVPGMNESVPLMGTVPKAEAVGSLTTAHGEHVSHAAGGTVMMTCPRVLT